MSRPTVALDSRMMQHSGIGTYLRHLAQGLAKTPDSTRAVAMRYYGHPQTLEKFLPQVSSEAFGHFEAPIYSLREHWEFALLPKQWDIWHCPHYNVPFIKKGKLVVTVHDLIHLVFQGQFFSAVQGWYARRSFDLVRKHANAIIAVSQHTKKDLMELVGIPSERITVIHEGVGEEFQAVQDHAVLANLRTKYQLPKKFLLYVGNIKPHKNVGQLVHVFRDLKQKKKIEEDLVLVGKPDRRFLEHDKDLCAAAKNSTVHFLSEVPMEDLPGLYTLATAFILPSLYEGFGLPVLEAMACGVPTIVSNRASLPEIAGDAAKIFNPDDDATLSEAILDVTQDAKTHQTLTQASLSRAKQFSWDRMVQETLNLYISPQ